MITQITPEFIATRFGCTADQVRAQFARNATSLTAMAVKAAATGRKLNGYTAAQLRAMAAQARRKAQ